jgi:hypothetical protein
MNDFLPRNTALTTKWSWRTVLPLMMLFVFANSASAESTRQLQVVYVIPQGEEAKPLADEAITEIITILQWHYLQQLGVTFELKEPLITYVESDLDAKNAVDWNNNFELIRTEFAEDYTEGENVVFSILEGTTGSAGGSWNIVKMTGGFWNTAYETYRDNPEQLANELHGWSHELGHAFGLVHTEDAKPCLAKHGIHLGTLPSLIMQWTEDLGSVFNYTFVEAEKKLLLDPDYFPDCRPLLSPPGLEKPHASKHLRIRSLL